MPFTGSSVSRAGQQCPLSGSMPLRNEQLQWDNPWCDRDSKDVAQTLHCLVQSGHRIWAAVALKNVIKMLLTCHDTTWIAKDLMHRFILH